jgi:hypothetical protein
VRKDSSPSKLIYRLRNDSLPKKLKRGRTLNNGFTGGITEFQADKAREALKLERTKTKQFQIDKAQNLKYSASGK